MKVITACSCVVAATMQIYILFFSPRDLNELHRNVAKDTGHAVSLVKPSLFVTCASMALGYLGRIVKSRDIPKIRNMWFLALSTGRADGQHQWRLLALHFRQRSRAAPRRRGSAGEEPRQHVLPARPLGRERSSWATLWPSRFLCPREPLS